MVSVALDAPPPDLVNPNGFPARPAPHRGAGRAGRREIQRVSGGSSQNLATNRLTLIHPFRMRTTRLNQSNPNKKPTCERASTSATFRRPSGRKLTVSATGEDTVSRGMGSCSEFRLLLVFVLKSLKKFSLSSRRKRKRRQAAALQKAENKSGVEPPHSTCKMFWTNLTFISSLASPKFYSTTSLNTGN